ncbi:MAG: glycine C-acetyltransferase [Nitrospinaceae bacterium]|jgi:glycine C-acetyltransferase|nr:glycine C-acetyltransferase [Nitrospina sp.]MBT5376127.1 glycine C-acetyltransferase [Nitrospinaceae bacterium]MBT5868964.1 glycine C-acetyltransferase [Nitrospinaceae bacterium]MBT6347482.1 glycine C-acetyltransferase [Nitrospina sp.]
MTDKNTDKFYQHILSELETIHDSGLYKGERMLLSPQGTTITTGEGKKVLNFCANNYLGLANHPEIIHAAQKALERYGYGMASVRFICGTQEIHKQLEQKISQFLQTEDTILYSSCFDANGGLFEALLTEKDAVISDRLNHASIIDGIRLCKANRFRYNHMDMNHLETQLQRAQKYRHRIIATDGVFSMDGHVAPLQEICDLADRYDAKVMVDDSHATGFFGNTGRGSIEYQQVMERIDIVTSTFGKALGGASGGFTSGRKEVIELLRQRSRPYLFSNSLSPVIVATTLKAINLISSSLELNHKLRDNVNYFRSAITAAGFNIEAGDHPIIPIRIGDACVAKNMADQLLKEGIYVIAFSYPVVPQNTARIRIQVSAAHELTHLDQAISAFIKISPPSK